MEAADALAQACSDDVAYLSPTLSGSRRTLSSPRRRCSFLPARTKQKKHTTHKTNKTCRSTGGGIPIERATHARRFGAFSKIEQLVGGQAGDQKRARDTVICYQVLYISCTATSPRVDRSKHAAHSQCSSTTVIENQGALCFHAKTLAVHTSAATAPLKSGTFHFHHFSTSPHATATDHMPYSALHGTSSRAFCSCLLWITICSPNVDVRSMSPHL